MPTDLTAMLDDLERKASLCIYAVWVRREDVTRIARIVRAAVEYVEDGSGLCQCYDGTLETCGICRLRAALAELEGDK